MLLVDDEPVLLRLMAEMVGNDHEVVTAGSGREALALLERGERFDAVLCDLSMPQMTGTDLFTCIAERWPEQSARVAFLTGGVFTRQAEEALARTKRPHLEKPFSTESLRAIIRRLRDGSLEAVETAAAAP